MENELTGAQKSYIMKYYGEGKNIRKIAAECGVYPSTVSRTIDRAAKKLQKAIDNAQKLCG
jgi:DNA-directed RNA polymerase specialized sigma subunit